MKKIPKFILGFLLLIALIYFFSNIFSPTNTKGSKVSVLSSQNKFDVEFNLSNLDNQNFKNFLVNLNAPNKLEEGFTFELDSTSSTALSFSSPIEFDVSIGAQSVLFKGVMDKPLLNNSYKIRKINVPQNSNLVIFTGKLHKYLSQKEKYPPSITSWIEENFKSTDGEYLVLFESSQEYALLSQKSNITLSTLKNLSFDSDTQNPYKEENIENINFHLLRIGESKSSERTIALFSYNDWTILASSRSASKVIIDALSGNSNSINIPVKESEKNTNFYLYFINDKYPINDSFKKFILSSKDFPLNIESNAASKIDSIKSIELSLMGTSISGLINIK